MGIAAGAVSPLATPTANVARRGWERRLFFCWPCEDLARTWPKPRGKQGHEAGEGTRVPARRHRRGLHPRTATEDSLRDAVGVVGSELSDELALNSSELRLSEASLSPLLMELLSSQLRHRGEKG